MIISWTYTYIYICIHILPIFTQRLKIYCYVLVHLCIYTYIIRIDIYIYICICTSSISHVVAQPSSILFTRCLLAEYWFFQAERINTCLSWWLYMMAYYDTSSCWSCLFVYGVLHHWVCLYLLFLFRSFWACDFYPNIFSFGPYHGAPLQFDNMFHLLWLWNHHLFSNLPSWCYSCVCVYHKSCLQEHGEDIKS